MVSCFFDFSKSWMYCICSWNPQVWGGFEEFKAHLSAWKACFELSLRLFSSMWLVRVWSTTKVWSVRYVCSLVINYWKKNILIIKPGSSKVCMDWLIVHRLKRYLLLRLLSSWDKGHYHTKCVLVNANDCVHLLLKNINP